MIDAMLRWGLVVCVAVGCSSHEAAPPKTTVNAAPKTQCAQVADHLVSEMTGAKKASPEEVDPYRQLIEKRCNEDKWSAKIQRCLLASNTLAENELCEPMFTDEQNANLNRDGAAAEKAAEKSDRKTGDPDSGGQ